jgi:hypothetical protein
VQEVPAFIEFAPVRQLAQMNWRKLCCTSAPVAPVVIPANWSSALTGAHPALENHGGRAKQHLPRDQTDTSRKSGNISNLVLVGHAMLQ